MRRVDSDTGRRSLRIRIPASGQQSTSASSQARFDKLPSDILERWIEAESLNSLTAMAFREFSQVFGATHLLLVSWIGVRQNSWAIFPRDERYLKLADEVFSYPGTRFMSLLLNPELQRHAPPPEALISDSRLVDAGFNSYTMIETGSEGTFHVFWDDNVTAESERGTVHTPESDTLWRCLRIVLGNLARLDRLRDLSHVDFTTGIFNRRYFELRLGEEVSRARRFKRPLSLAVLDIDKFKTLNDNYGHQAGDAILNRVAECVRWTTRSIDVFCRLGGDEFTVLMPDADLTENTHLGDRLRDVLERRSRGIAGVPDDATITISIGGAVFPRHCDDESRLIWCADMALLEAKRQGRNQFVLFQDALGCPADAMGHGESEER